jgi:hypothetical protein
MQNLIKFIQSEPFWAAVTVLMIYLANSVVSRGIIAKLPPTGGIRRSIRALHGFLNRVDPMVIAVALALPLLTGCSILKSPTFWDAAEKACVIALTATPEVQSEAKTRSLTGNEWASVLCKLSDVIEPYVVETETAKATPKALGITKARGLTK